MENQNKLAGLGIAIVAAVVAVWGVSTLGGPDRAAYADHDSGGAHASSTAPIIEIRAGAAPVAAATRRVHIPTATANQELFSFVLANLSPEPVNVYSVSVAASSTPTIVNFKLYRASDGSRVGSVVGKPAPDGASSYGIIAFTGLGVRLAASSTERFIMRADTRTLRQGAQSGSQHQFSIPERWFPRGFPPVVADGAISTLPALVRGSAPGDTYIVYAGVLRARLNAASPGGLASPASEQTVATFDLWRLDQGERLPILRDFVVLDFSSTIVNTRERSVRLYYEESGRARRRLGSATLPVGPVRGVLVRIGQTKIGARSAAPARLIVTMDTTDATAARTLTTTLRTLVWTDQVTRVISDIMDLPLAARTLSY